MPEYTLRVNGGTRRCAPSCSESLLDTLRERMNLRGAKAACLEGECGACTVLVDGHGLNSCLLPTAAVGDAEIRTVEGLDAFPQAVALRQAFAAHGAVQCGFCTPGILVSLTELLIDNPTPTRDDVLNALTGHICRCTGYAQIADAALAASSLVEARS